MLKNMKIKMSLIMGFSVTILVSLAIVITSLVVMNIQSASYQKIIDTNVRASALVRTCRLNANMAARALRDVALDPTSDYVATASGIVSEKLGELEKDIPELRTLHTLEDEALVNEYISANVVETPKEIHDGPFAENIKKVSAKNLAGLEEITCAQAEKLAAKYFESYKVSDVKCTGEVTAESLTCYNVTMQTKDGEMSAQLSKQGGKVVEFNSYKDCNDKNFSVERCVDIAQDFLKALGFKNMKAVWTSENGTTCNLNFAYEQNGVVIYPDMVKVKVCEERGIVTGMEGLAYVLNHTQRELGSAKISKSEAKAVLNGGFEAEGSRLCLIPVDGGEVLCYEFYGAYGGNDYYIYVDAATGNEVEVFTVIGTAQGKALM